MITTKEEQLVTVTAKRITAKSLFKLIFVSGLIPGAVFFLLIGISAANGSSDALRINGESITGTKAIFYAIGLYLPALVGFSAMTWLIAAPGLFLYSLWKPITLDFKA
jgi:hypothetical protein